MVLIETHFEDYYIISLEEYDSLRTAFPRGVKPSQESVCVSVNFSFVQSTMSAFSQPRLFSVSGNSLFNYVVFVSSVRCVSFLSADEFIQLHLCLVIHVCSVDCKCFQSAAKVQSTISVFQPVVY